MILGDVEETVTTVEIDEETYEELYKVRRLSGPGSGSSSDVLIWPACVPVNKEEHPHAVCARRRRGARSPAPASGLVAVADGNRVRVISDQR